MSSFVWLVVVATSIWVYFDAILIGAKMGLTPGFFNLWPASRSQVAEEGRWHQKARETIDKLTAKA